MPFQTDTEWDAHLPTMFGSAAALFTNRAGQVLLVIQWVPPEGDRPKPIVHFVFDGGVLEDDVPIRPQPEELDDYRFADPGDLDGYLPPFLSARVSAGLRGRAAGRPAYLWQSTGPP